MHCCNSLEAQVYCSLLYINIIFPSLTKLLSLLLWGANLLCLFFFSAVAVDSAGVFSILEIFAIAPPLATIWQWLALTKSNCSHPLIQQQFLLPGDGILLKDNPSSFIIENLFEITTIILYSLKYSFWFTFETPLFSFFFFFSPVSSSCNWSYTFFSSYGFTYKEKRHSLYDVVYQCSWNFASYAMKKKKKAQELVCQL